MSIIYAAHLSANLEYFQLKHVVSLNKTYSQFN